jgi:caffeoyl-CoA O-methyltransferase
MARGSFFLSYELEKYASDHAEPEDEVLAALAAETAELPQAGMQSGREVGLLLGMLARLTGARTAVEVGTFTGYSSICIARGLAAGGRLTCFDVSDEWTSMARRYWERAGVADRIELRLGPAADGLRALPTDPTIDLAYVDADKPGYLDYYEQLVPRLRPGGVLVADNVLLGGRVIGTPPEDDGTAASVAGIHAFNDRALADDRVDAVLLTISDGVSLVQKR